MRLKLALNGTLARALCNSNEMHTASLPPGLNIRSISGLFFRCLHEGEVMSDVVEPMATFMV